MTDTFMVPSSRRIKDANILGQPKKLVAAFLFCLTALLPATSWAQQTPPLATIAAINPSINFGSFAVLPSCVNCTITVSPAGVRSSTGGVILTSGVAANAASYTVTIQNANNNGQAQYTVVTPWSPASVNMVAGAATMIVGAFTSAQSVVPTKLSPTNILTVGATLTIPSSVAAGAYTSSAFTVTTSP